MGSGGECVWWWGECVEVYDGVVCMIEGVLYCTEGRQHFFQHTDGRVVDIPVVPLFVRHKSNDIHG